jgi:hypothetical protein
MFVAVLIDHRVGKIDKMHSVSKEGTLHTVPLAFNMLSV